MDEDGVLVLLGAGATYGVFQRYLTQLSETLWNTLTCHPIGKQFVYVAKPLWDERMAPSARTTTQASVAPRPAPARPNFEDLIDAVDAWVRWFGAQNKNLNFSFTDGLANRLLGKAGDVHSLFTGLESTPETMLKQYDDVAKLARVLRDQVLEAVSNPPSLGTPPIHQLMCRLFLELRSRNRTLVVASLNYDAVLDTAVPEWDTGFRLDRSEPKGNRSLRRFDAQFEHDAATADSPVYMPLHGSLHFVPVRAVDTPTLQTTRVSPLEPLWADDLATARSYWHVLLHSNDAEWPVDVRMITGRHKTNTLQVNPYAAYWTRLRREAAHRQQWLIVGYSARDKHVNAALMHAWQAHLSRGSSPHVVVVDKWTTTSEAISWGNALGGLAARIHFNICHPSSGWWKLWANVGQDGRWAPVGWVWPGGVETLDPADLLKHLL